MYRRTMIYLYIVFTFQFVNTHCVFYILKIIMFTVKFGAKMFEANEKKPPTHFEKVTHAKIYALKFNINIHFHKHIYGYII